MELEIAKKAAYFSSRRTCCEVCLDRPAGRAVSAVVAVLRDVGQHERLSRMEARRNIGTNTTDGHAIADVNPHGACRGQGSIRLATHNPGSSRSRLPGQQGTSGTTDARKRHPGPAQAPLSRDDGSRDGRADDGMVSLPSRPRRAVPFGPR